MHLKRMYLELSGFAPHHTHNDIYSGFLQALTLWQLRGVQGLTDPGRGAFQA